MALSNSALDSVACEAEALARGVEPKPSGIVWLQLSGAVEVGPSLRIDRKRRKGNEREHQGEWEEAGSQHRKQECAVRSESRALHRHPPSDWLKQTLRQHDSLSGMDV